MWITIITTAIAASVCLGVVNLASEINRIRDLKYSSSVEHKPQSDARRLEQSLGAARTNNQWAANDNAYARSEIENPIRR